MEKMRICNISLIFLLSAMLVSPVYGKPPTTPFKKYYMEVTLLVTYMDDSGTHTFRADIKSTLNQRSTILHSENLEINVNDLLVSYNGPATIYYNGVKQDVEHYFYITFASDFGGLYSTSSGGTSDQMNTKNPIDKLKNGGTTTMKYFSMVTIRGTCNGRVTDYDFFIQSNGKITRTGQTSWEIVYSQAEIKQRLFQRYPYLDYPYNYNVYQPDYVEINPIHSISGIGTIMLIP